MFGREGVLSKNLQTSTPDPPTLSSIPLLIPKTLFLFYIKKPIFRLRRFFCLFVVWLTHERWGGGGGVVCRFVVLFLNQVFVRRPGGVWGVFSHLPRPSLKPLRASSKSGICGTSGTVPGPLGGRPVPSPPGARRHKSDRIRPWSPAHGRRGSGGFCARSLPPCGPGGRSAARPAGVYPCGVIFSTPFGRKARRGRYFATTPLFQFCEWELWGSFGLVLGQSWQLPVCSCAPWSTRQSPSAGQSRGSRPGVGARCCHSVGSGVETGRSLRGELPRSVPQQVPQSGGICGTKERSLVWDTHRSCGTQGLCSRVFVRKIL